jgi:cytochrome c
MKAISIASWVALAVGMLMATGPALAQSTPTQAGPENPEAAALAHKLATMPSAPVNAEAARLLAKRIGCFRCHAIDKEHEKAGPNWKSVGDRFRPLPAVIQPIIQERLIYHLVSGEVAHFPDGHSEHHRFVKTDPPDDPAQIKNLVDWILSL